MNEVTRLPTQPMDNFGSYDDSVQTDDGNERVGSLVGIRLMFTNEASWVGVNGVNYTDKHRLAYNVRRTEVEWGTDDGPPLQVIELKPGEQYRDLDKVNAAIDKSRWREGPDGRLQGPWQRQHIFELVDIETMEVFSWPTSTTGGSICIREIVDKICRMRRFRGEYVYPLVKLSHTHMRTRFGGRERPHLEVLGWYRLGDHGTAVAAAPPPPMLTSSAAAQSPLQQVTEPSTSEELNDRIPF
jgi:hypothetical protein